MGGQCGTIVGKSSLHLQREKHSMVGESLKSWIPNPDDLCVVRLDSNGSEETLKFKNLEFWTWESGKSPDGRTYYWNAQRTDGKGPYTTQWENPWFIAELL